jgi:dihydrofolate reductase
LDQQVSRDKTEEKTMTQRRTVVGNISLSLDGRVSGAGGPYDMGWIVPHAVSDGARDHMTRLIEPATTALLGRNNYQGFGGFWPAVAKDESADPRDRGFGQWLDDVEKVVFSTTLEKAEWHNARIAEASPAGEVRALRARPGGDIVVLASSSVIRALLAADELDRLSITLCPEVVGGGARLLDDGLPASGWRPSPDVITTETGALCIFFDRVRD